MPPAPGLEGSTLRQVIHISVGGPTVRVHFSNTFGTGPLTITSAHIARSRGRSAIDLTTDRPLTFAGADSVRIAPGAMAMSDLLEYDVPALSDLAVTMLIGAAPADVTGHPGSRTTSFLQAGQWVSAAELPDAATTDHWYLIAGLDVVADGAAVVTLGNSITDGRGSGTDRNDRWPDNLAGRLQSDPRTRHVAVPARRCAQRRHRRQYGDSRRPRPHSAVAAGARRSLTERGALGDPAGRGQRHRRRA